MTAERTPATVDQIAANSRRIDEVTAECVRALDLAGVPQLLLKGPTTARWLYGADEPRPYVDSDLLVPPESVPLALDTLQGLGFVERYAGCDGDVVLRHAIELYRKRPDGGDILDLHLRLPLITDPAAPVWDVLSRGAEDTVVAGQRIRMPGESGRCLVTAIKAAQDGPSGTKGLEDLRRSRRVSSAAVWAEAVAMAAELDVDHTARLGCVLAGAPLPGTVVEADWAEASLDLRLTLIGAARGARSLAGLRGRPARDRLRYVARRIVPPRAFFAAVYGARTTPALIKAYLHRLMILAIRTPRAVHSVAAATAPPAFLRQESDAR